MPPSGSAGKSLRKLQSNFKHDMISDAVETPGIYENLFSCAYFKISVSKPGLIPKSAPISIVRLTVSYTHLTLPTSFLV